MKKREIAELKSKKIEELNAKMDQLKNEIVTNLLELKMGKLKNVHLINKKKKDVARLKTIIKFHYLEINKTGKLLEKEKENGTD